jgi:hypothetical protein
MSFDDAIVNDFKKTIVEFKDKLFNDWGGIVLDITKQINPNEYKNLFIVTNNDTQIELQILQYGGIKRNLQVYLFKNQPFFIPCWAYWRIKRVSFSTITNDDNINIINDETSLSIVASDAEIIDRFYYLVKELPSEEFNILITSDKTSVDRDGIQIILYGYALQN